MTDDLVVSGAFSAGSDTLVIGQWLHGKGERTREEYRRDIGQFLGFAQKPLAGVTLGDLQDWQDEIGEQLQQSSVRRKLVAIRSLLRFAYETGYLQFNVGKALPLPKVRDTLADRILTDADVKLMIKYEPNRRNRLLLRVLYMTGIRVSELCALQFRDVRRSKDGGVVNVFGKGRKSRQVWIPADLFEALISFRDGRKPTVPLFESRQHGFLTKQRVRIIVRTAAERVGIEGDVSPHFLRHTHATEALHSGCPIDLVSQTLGHSSVAVTSRYLHARPGESSAKYLPKG